MRRYVAFLVAVMMVPLVGAAPLTRGLNNLGNTCFMNATLQALAYVPKLVQVVHQDAPPIAEAPLTPLQEFNIVLQAMLDLEQPTPYTPQDFVDRVVRPVLGLYKTNNQEDAQEFFIKLYEVLETQMKPLFNQTVTEVKVCQSGHEKPIDRTNLFTAAFPFFALQEERLFLPELIKPRHSTIEGSRCDQCNVPIDQDEGLLAAGDYVLIRLGREVQIGQRLAKHKNPVDCPEELQLSYKNKDATKEPYDLFAVVVHRGSSLTAGHYYAYVRNVNDPSGAAWYLCDDSSVAQIDNASMQVVLQQVAPSNTTPYLLFYRRRGGHQVPKPVYSGVHLIKNLEQNQQLERALEFVRPTLPDDAISDGVQQSPVLRVHAVDWTDLATALHSANNSSAVKKITATTKRFVLIIHEKNGKVPPVYCPSVLSLHIAGAQKIFGVVAEIYKEEGSKNQDPYGYSLGRDLYGALLSPTAKTSTENMLRRPCLLVYDLMSGPEQPVPQVPIPKITSTNNVRSLLALLRLRLLALVRRV